MRDDRIEKRGKVRGEYLPDQSSLKTFKRMLRIGQKRGGKLGDGPALLTNLSRVFIMLRGRSKSPSQEKVWRKLLAFETKNKRKKLRNPLRKKEKR